PAGQVAYSNLGPRSHWIRLNFEKFPPFITSNIAKTYAKHLPDRPRQKTSAAPEIKFNDRREDRMRPPPKSDNGKYCRSSKSQDRIGIITGGRGVSRCDEHHSVG